MPISRPAIDAAQAANPSLYTQQTGLPQPSGGWYLATVSSYNSTTNTAVVTTTSYGTLTLSNYRGVVLTAGQVVVVVGSGTSNDVII